MSMNSDSNKLVYQECSKEKGAFHVFAVLNGEDDDRVGIGTLRRLDFNQWELTLDAGGHIEGVNSKKIQLEADTIDEALASMKASIGALNVRANRLSTDTFRDIAGDQLLAARRLAATTNNEPELLSMLGRFAGLMIAKDLQEDAHVKARNLFFEVVDEAIAETIQKQKAIREMTDKLPAELLAALARLKR